MAEERTNLEATRAAFGLFNKAMELNGKEIDDWVDGRPDLDADLNALLAAKKSIELLLDLFLAHWMFKQVTSEPATLDESAKEG